VKPELLTTRPNAVWSWDITKLLGPVKWTWFYLYVILDIYSRYVPGWMLARAERALLAERLLADTITKQHISRDQLTIHADRGASMASKPVAFLLADLGSPRATAGPSAPTTIPTARPSSRP
jgi:putative transposase